MTTTDHWLDVTGWPIEPTAVRCSAPGSQQWQFAWSDVFAVMNRMLLCSVRAASATDCVRLLFPTRQNCRYAAGVVNVVCSEKGASIYAPGSWRRVNVSLNGLLCRANRHVLWAWPRPTGRESTNHIVMLRAATAPFKLLQECQETWTNHGLSEGDAQGLELQSCDAECGSSGARFPQKIKKGSLWKTARVGVYIVIGRKLSFDITAVKQSFLLPVTPFKLRLKVLMRHCIYHSNRAICLPILTYAVVAALNLSARHENKFWNSAYRKLFGFHKWELRVLYIHGRNGLDLHRPSTIRLRRASFYRHIMLAASHLSCNNIVFFFIRSLTVMICL